MQSFEVYEDKVYLVFPSGILNRVCLKEKQAYNNSLKLGGYAKREETSLQIWRTMQKMI